MRKTFLSSPTPSSVLASLLTTGGILSSIYLPCSAFHVRNLTGCWFSHVHLSPVLIWSGFGRVYERSIGTDISLGKSLAGIPGFRNQLPRCVVSRNGAELRKIAKELHRWSPNSCCFSLRFYDSCSSIHIFSHYILGYTVGSTQRLSWNPSPYEDWTGKFSFPDNLREIQLIPSSTCYFPGTCLFLSLPGFRVRYLYHQTLGTIEPVVLSRRLSD